MGGSDRRGRTPTARAPPEAADIRGHRISPTPDASKPVSTRNGGNRGGIDAAGKEKRNYAPLKAPTPPHCPRAPGPSTYRHRISPSGKHAPDVW